LHALFLAWTSQVNENMALLMEGEDTDEGAKQTEPNGKLYNGGDHHGGVYSDRYRRFPQFL
jgi:hypothetical protein